jgi:hypothetical protein
MHLLDAVVCEHLQPLPEELDAGSNGFWAVTLHEKNRDDVEGDVEPVTKVHNAACEAHGRDGANSGLFYHELRQSIF